MPQKLLLLFACFASLPVFAQDWPHWRGPEGNGTHPTAKPPIRWSQTENVVWSTAIPGRGSGSPIVSGDFVFVTTATAPGGKDPTPGRLDERLSFRLLALDRKTGNIVWDRICIEAIPHEGTHSTNGFASSSPCTDGETVIAHFGSRGVYAYDLAGNRLWERKDFAPMTTRAGFGEGSSPTIVDDLVIVPHDHEGPSKLYAIDLATGEDRWVVDRDEPTNWATPLIVGVGDARQVVMNGQTMARGYDLATGKELWRCGGQTQRPVASPVANEDTVFVGSGFRGSFLGAFDFKGRGNLEGTPQVRWTIDRATPDIASLLLSDDRLFFHQAKTGILSCVSAQSGQPFFFQQRLPAIRTTYASPVAAGGHVYATGRSGVTVVLKDAPEFEVVATNQVGEGVDATPAIAGDAIFIRGERHLMCIADRSIQ